jgi:hypothetical protein
VRSPPPNKKAAAWRRSRVSPQDSGIAIGPPLGHRRNLGGDAVSIHTNSSFVPELSDHEFVLNINVI